MITKDYHKHPITFIVLITLLVVIVVVMREKRSQVTASSPAAFIPGAGMVTQPTTLDSLSPVADLQQALGAEITYDNAAIASLGASNPLANFNTLVNPSDRVAAKLSPLNPAHMTYAAHLVGGGSPTLMPPLTSSAQLTAVPSI